MATNFTEFTSDASPSGGVVLVGHNIAGTGEIKTTIDQILSAMNLATDSDASFNSLSLSGNMSLSDGATIDVGSGTGDLNITGGDLNFDGQIVLGEGSNAYPAICFDNQTQYAAGLLYNKTSGSTPFIGIANGNTTILSVGRFWAGITTGDQGRGVGFLGFSSSYNPTKENMDARIHRESTGHLSITDENDALGTLELADLIASGDITLADGATIDVGSGTGALNVDGDLIVSEGIETPLFKFPSVSPNTSHPKIEHNGLSYNSGRINFYPLSSGGVSMLSVTNYKVGVNTLALCNGNADGTERAAIGSTSSNAVKFGTTSSFATLASLECAGIDASGDITLADGATIDVGGGTGEVTIDGDLKLSNSHNTATLQREINITTNTPHGGFVMSNSGNNTKTLTLTTSDTGSRALTIKDFQGNETLYTNHWGSIYSIREFNLTSTGGVIRIGGMNENHVPLQVRSSHVGVDTAIFEKKLHQSSDLTCWRDESENKKIVIDNNFNLGIGVAAPTEALDVDGNFNLSGDISLTDGATITVGDGTDDITIDGTSLFTNILKIGSGGNNQNGELRTRTIRLSDNTGNSTAKIYSSGAWDADLKYHAFEHHFTRAGIPRLSITNTEVVFNHSNSHNNWGPDVDFRVEGSGGRTNALVVQGYDGFVGIGVASPTVELDVLGDAKISGDITQGGNAVLDESYFTPQTLTDGATIAYDVSNGVNAKVTLGGDRTLAAITNAAEGQSGSLTVIQDATGGRALTLDASQTDMLGTLADIAGMGANEECEIAWRKTDATKCKFWITIPA